MLVADIKKTIREIPDFPKPGINFYDVSTLFSNALAFRAAIDRMVERYRGDRIDLLVGIEARGFIVAAAMAHELGIGMVMVRKRGKLPGETETESYALEYGESEIEVHRDAVTDGQRVVIVDDLLATGGTALAAGRLIRRLGARVDGYAFLIELGFLGGRAKFDMDNVFALIRYD